MNVEETACRNDLICAVSELIQSKWPSATVVPFGSFTAGLSTFTSDIDITVHNVGNIESENRASPVYTITADKQSSESESSARVDLKAHEDTSASGQREFPQTNSHEPVVQSPSAKRQKIELDIDHDMVFNVKEMVQVQVPSNTTDMTFSTDVISTYESANAEATTAALDRDIIVSVDSGSESEAEYVGGDDRWTLQQPGYRSLIDLTAEDEEGPDDFQLSNTTMTPVEKRREQELKKIAVNELKTLFPHMTVSENMLF